MTVVGWIITGGTAWFCFCALAVLVCWRFTAIRPTLDAVLVERCAKPSFGESVWAGLDRALAEPWDEPDEVSTAEDQAIAVAAGSNDDHFALWENELRERAS